MAKLAVPGPFDEAYLTTISGRTQCARRRGSPLALVNGVFGISRASSRARRSSSSLVSKPVPIFPAKHEVVPVEVPDQQRAETHALALRIGEAADDEVVRLLALHLQPVLRAAMLVGRVAALRDDALPSFGAGALPGLRIVEQRHLRERQSERHAAQQRATLFERQRASRRGHRATGCRTRSSPPAERAPPPGRLRRRGSTSWTGRFAIAWTTDGCELLCGSRLRENKPNVGAVLEREQPDAVELALEDPLGPGEPVLCERRRHRLEPFGKRGRHGISTPTITTEYLARTCAGNTATASGVTWRHPSTLISAQRGKRGEHAPRRRS